MACVGESVSACPSPGEGDESVGHVGGVRQVSVTGKESAASPFHENTLLSLRESAEVLGCSYSTVTKWTSRGEFCPEAVRLPNGQYRVRYGDLMRWVRSLRRY